MYSASGSRRTLSRLCCLSFLWITGCYSYSPLEKGRPDAGAEVRLYLTDRGRQVISERTIVNGTDLLAGRVIKSGDSRVHILVSRAARDVFAPDRLIRDSVTVPYDVIETLEMKRIETTKTATLVGGMTAGLMFAGVTLARGASGERRPRQGDDRSVSIVVPFSVSFTIPQ